MLPELFSFQKQAVRDLRTRVAMALNNYRACHVPQVISLQAPTGSGKTIIMSALIEDIFFGNDQFAEQPEAIFVWLSDSPQLNEQSKQKIETKADKIRINQCVTISDESFDQEMLEDGHIYFLNTQKLGVKGNLSHHSDGRQYTIWETLENTAKEKSDRLYFIIDEAHRGMQIKDRASGVATSIMQRFILGYPAQNLNPMPIVIGMSATPERFTALVGKNVPSLQQVIVPASQVRASGLLKDRIVLTYPEDPTKHNDMAVLQAATDEWISKCAHWYQYTSEQHYANVNPVFVVQVLAGTGKKLTDTDLDDVLAKIEERLGSHFKGGEVVHTFGSIGTIQINGLDVPHIEPSDIADNRNVRVVFFKENLSTGWDCPRAETMMSFRHAEDATYIAQLLGRMVRTPLQCHILVDDSLNDVRLYLPYFNEENVKKVIDELQSTEGGDIPVVVDGEAIGAEEYVPWSVHTPNKPRQKPVDPNQLTLDFDNPNGGLTTPASAETTTTTVVSSPEPIAKPIEESSPVAQPTPVNSQTPLAQTVPQQAAEVTQAVPETPTVPTQSNQKAINEEVSAIPSQPVQPIQPEPPVKPVTPTPQVPTNNLFRTIDREEVIRFINDQGFLTYQVRTVKINSYLKSLLDLAGLLTQTLIYQDANDDIKDEVTDLMKTYIDSLHASGKYDDLARQVMEFKLSIQIFDPFGEAVTDFSINDLLATSETDLDRQLRAADAKLGGYGFPYVYGRRFLDFNDTNAFKVDCILFAADDECIASLNKYAEKKFHELNDKYRKYVVSKSEKLRKEYSDIVANGDIISKHNFTLPETINARVEKDGLIYDDHLFADSEGYARIKLNNWEQGVLAEEEKQEDFVCWLRNPPRQSWSLCIPYEIDGTTKSAYPDFIVVRKDKDLGYIMDILEPHSADFKDNLGKAKGFAKYAEEEIRIGRIELIRMGKDAAGKNRFKRLDMGKGAIRQKVLSAVTNDELDHIFDTDGEFLD